MIRTTLLVSLGLLALAAPAHAAERVLAPGTDMAGLAAYRGQVVTSRLNRQTGQWELVRWHAGVVDALPVAPRPVPFDADAGPDAAGRPVLVYSRCAQEAEF